MAANNEGFPMKRILQSSKKEDIEVHQNGSPLDNGQTVTRDDADMAYFGKRPQLRRNFGILAIVALTCTLMITWEGLLFVFVGSFTNGGPTGLVIGFIIGWVGTFLQALVMGELGSMIPLAGGEYNWVAVLAPPSCKKFLSYITGWISIIAWQAINASATLVVGTMIQGMVILNHPEYVPERWHATLIFYAVTAIAFFFNSYLGRLLPQIESVILAIHIVGFFAVLIPLVYMAPKGSVEDVFHNFLNEGQWPTYGLSFCIGTVTTMYAFIGVDAATHMAEEIENAAEVIPKAMIATVALNGSMGFGMLLAVLFCLGDLDAALHTPTGAPIMQIFYGATGSKSGATVMIAIILVAWIFAVVGVLATGPRMLWAFAREKGVPFSDYISRVEPHTVLPLWSIGITVLLNLLLALVNIGSTVAFNALTGLTVATYYTSFTVAASIMLHKRLTTPEEEFRWGPFKLGRWGVPVYILAIAYSVFGAFFSFFPPASEVNPQSMNWSVLVFGGSMILAVVYWFAYARHVYKGPIVEI